MLKVPQKLVHSEQQIMFFHCKILSNQKKKTLVTKFNSCELNLYSLTPEMHIKMKGKH